MKYILFSAFTFLQIIAFAQAPQGINYQAVIRNSTGVTVNNSPVGLRIKILQGTPTGSAVYTESFSETTSNIGLVNVIIGQGTVLSGTFSGINWGAGPYFLEVAADANGGTNYTVLGSQQMMSVPYALYAENSGTPGPAGPVGPQGPTGAAGANGQDGLSAYEMWLTQGNTGTQADFLTSLTGPQGATGATGPQGVTGATGPQGATGPTGAQGIQGATGQQGPQGPTGPSGPVGCLQTNTILKSNGSGATCSNITDNGTSVGINNTNPYSGAALDISSSNQGFLPPRLTAAQRNGITNPQPGLTIFNTDVNCMEWWNGTGWYSPCFGNINGSIGTLNCGSASNNGILTQGQSATGVTSQISYTLGNGGFYNDQMIFSTGVTGLIATTNYSSFVSGSGTITYTISGTPNSSGTASFTITIGGQTCMLTRTVDANPAALYPTGAVFCNGPTAIVNATNPTTGKVWMDRNLGAIQVATTNTTANSYGDLYQWGRFADGHQCRNSATTNTVSSTNNPPHGNFIIAASAPNDWRNPQNVYLWSVGVNNPCPLGYRVPSDAELNAERASWSSNNSNGAFASALKWPLAGGRSGMNGTLVEVGVSGNYYTSTVVSSSASLLYFASNNALMTTTLRSFGLSVRCIKNEP